MACPKPPGTGIFVRELALCSQMLHRGRQARRVGRRPQTRSFVTKIVDSVAVSPLTETQPLLTISCGQNASPLDETRVAVHAR